MDPLTAAAASGIQARLDSLDMLANNMANGSTSGFKVDREFYSTVAAGFGPSLLDPATGDSPVIEKQWTDFAQGSLVTTGNATDLAISGSGFFSVNGPNGPLYTRNGNFRIASNGVLTTAEGYAVGQPGGGVLQTQGSAPIRVSADGIVTQNNQQIGQLAITSFSDPQALTRAMTGYFQNPDPKANPATAATDMQVEQGKLESANTSAAESAARMVSLLRHFEMLQHAAKIGADMNKQAVEEVARIPS